MKIRPFFCLLPWAFAVSFAASTSLLHAAASSAKPEAPRRTAGPKTPGKPSPGPTPRSDLYTFDTLWGSPGSRDSQFQGPQDVDVAEDGTLFVADTGNHRICVWSAEGRPLRTFGSFGPLAVWQNPPQFNRPAGVLAHPSGKVYVSDTGNHRVVVVDAKGLVVTAFGQRGNQDGDFDLPRSLALDHFGNLWVLDSGNSRVQVLSALGAHRQTWGKFGEAPGHMKHPLGMDLNRIDQAIVADTDNFRLQVFNDEGEPVTLQGWYGDGPSQFREPVGVAVTPEGLIAVTDGASGRVLFFNQRFEYAGEWRADRQIFAEKFTPNFRGVASDAQSRLYIADAGNHVVLRLKPLFQQDALAPRERPTPTPADGRFYGGQGYPVR